MTPDALEPRLNFLKKAAHALAVSSPTISSVLGSAHRSLLSVNDMDIGAQAKSWDALGHEMCGSCGSVILPGWTSSITRQMRRKGKEGQPKDLKEPEKPIIYVCLRCDRKTPRTLQVRPAKHMVTKTTAKVIEPWGTKPPIEQDSKVTKSASATSKQRKKARKGGLQAMLEKSKSISSSGGLELMDFMS
ncbi:hypothetical protein CC80DRAFT_413748 [Byssothecium circinans]|uniref:Rpr2-domain-containing protein n=1 Tax=Byssothecium circinans TaxID=147558 RepID=A0A6A5TW34_9PLEO|nr:hypothetical protein CC80DRAFT_413748 [Byssothecium circinans]